LKTINRRFQLLLAIAVAMLFANDMVSAQPLTDVRQAMSDKHKRIILVNNQSSPAEVNINFGADSKINVNNLGGFCDSASVAPLQCHLTLDGQQQKALPNPNFKYVNMAVAFNHAVACGATKAEVIANNHAWYDIMDVSVVDGFNNRSGSSRTPAPLADRSRSLDLPPGNPAIRSFSGSTHSPAPFALAS
jgi:hypothetical protein